jgi:predicted GNAT family acetyltransferase
MVAVPIDGSWTVRRLGERDRSRVVSWLELEPLKNVFLISKITDEGLGMLTPFVEILLDGRTIVVAAVGSNIVLAADQSGDAAVLDSALAMLADIVVTGYNPVRAIIAEAELVERLWKRMATRVDPPTVVRLNQPVYVIERSDLHFAGNLSRMRYATLQDLDILVPACAAMHREEVGIDPMSRDAVAYRQRIRELIAQKRSVVRLISGRVAFKCEYSAVTNQYVQLMGVWTAPELRRRGYAREGLIELCAHVRRLGKGVTLFVNDFNRPARALYESIGFHQEGANRALIW